MAFDAPDIGGDRRYLLRSASLLRGLRPDQSQDFATGGHPTSAPGLVRGTIQQYPSPSNDLKSVGEGIAIIDENGAEPRLPGPATDRGDDCVAVADLDLFLHAPFEQ